VRRIGTAQRGKRLVTQMRGRAAAIGRSANRCRNRRSQEVGRTAPRRADADVDSAQSDQSAGQWQSMQPPLRAESRSWLPRVPPSVRGPGKPGRSTTNPALCKTHLLQLLGFEDMILLRTGGLAASPPVRYTLETAEQCRVSTVPLLVSSPRFVQRVARVLASLYAAPPPPSPDWYERTRIKRSPHQWC
jgi:hypothetical protein